MATNSTYCTSISPFLTVTAWGGTPPPFDSNSTRTCNPSPPPLSSLPFQRWYPWVSAPVVRGHSSPPSYFHSNCHPPTFALFNFQHWWLLPTDCGNALTTHDNFCPTLLWLHLELQFAFWWFSRNSSSTSTLSWVNLRFVSCTSRSLPIILFILFFTWCHFYYFSDDTIFYLFSSSSHFSIYKYLIWQECSHLVLFGHPVR